MKKYIQVYMNSKYLFKYTNKNGLILFDESVGWFLQSKAVKLLHRHLMQVLLDL
jgi:hypothetical protein